MKAFQFALLLLIASCSSEKDKAAPDESVKGSISEHQIKPVEKGSLEPQVKQLKKAIEVNTSITRDTNNLRKKTVKRTNSKFVKNSVEVVPWDLDSEKNWNKQNDPEFVEDPRVVVPWEE